MGHLRHDDLQRCSQIRHGKRAEMEEILREISAATGIPGHVICGRDRTAHVAEARQLAYYVARRKGLTLMQIGEFFGRDHTSVSHGAREEAKRRGEA